MEEFLKNLIGKKVDISCTSTRGIRGEIREVKDGILYLYDEDENPSYVAVDKIAIVCEVRETGSRPGFVV